MRFACIGGDRRQTETALYLQSKGHTVLIFGLPRNSGLKSADSLCEAVSCADAVILPLPVSRDGKTVNTPLTNDVIFLQDMIQCRPERVLGGIVKPDLAAELNNQNIPYYDYYQSEALTVRNAVLTAEAAIAIAVNCTDRSIYGSKALVIGFGRIGRQLARYLKCMGANVTATSRDSGTLAVIEADGIRPMYTGDCAKLAGEFDYIFNTAPSPVMNSEFFYHCRKNAFVEDLASDSGTDFAAAAANGVRASLCGGLPGKHAPVTAAEYIAGEILEWLNSNSRDNGG